MFLSILSLDKIRFFSLDVEIESTLYETLFNAETGVEKTSCCFKAQSGGNTLRSLRLCPSKTVRVVCSQTTRTPLCAMVGKVNK